MKKADIWISAVLYMALGIVILTIVLAAGIPIINKIKDKNLAIETKEVMITIDKNIRAVYNEGPGSRRPLKLEIKKGSLVVDNSNETIEYQLRTSVLLSQPDIEIQEGNLKILTQTTTAEKEYLTRLKLDYNGILNLTLQSSSNILSGTNNLVITNIGNNEILMTVI